MQVAAVLRMRLGLTIQDVCKANFAMEGATWLVQMSGNGSCSFGSSSQKLVNISTGQGGEQQFRTRNYVILFQPACADAER